MTHSSRSEVTKQSDQKYFDSILTAIRYFKNAQTSSPGTNIYAMVSHRDHNFSLNLMFEANIKAHEALYL